MGNLSEQKITVLCDFSENMNGVILHGIQLAGFLEKELCLFALSGNEPEKKDWLHNRLSELARVIKSKGVDLPISTLVLKGNLSEQVERLVDRYDSVVLIVSKNQLSVKLKALHESTIPFLFVEGKPSDRINYRKVLLPVDFRKEMKETSLWASYFARFNKAEIEVLAAREKQHEYQQSLKKNLVFIGRFLKNLKLTYTLTEGKSNSWKIPFEALKCAANGDYDVLITLGSKNITPLDLFIGLPEKKLIRKAQSISILCINPAKDMNILCD